MRTHHIPAGPIARNRNRSWSVSRAKRRHGDSRHRAAGRSARDGYVAIHIGGYRQPKREWLEQISSGEMAYHSIEEQSTTVTVDGDTAILDAKALVDATIYGGRATWPLRSRTAFALTPEGWKAMSSEATTY